jgi:hypothetical protein
MKETIESTPLNTAEEELSEILQKEIDAELEEDFLTPFQKALKTKNYCWCTIDTPAKSNTDKNNNYHYSSGEEEGIQWYIDLDCKNAEWIVTVTDGENTYTENFKYLYEPIFGIDIADSARIEGILDKFISKCKENNKQSFISKLRESIRAWKHKNKTNL